MPLAMCSLKSETRERYSPAKLPLFVPRKLELTMSMNLHRSSMDFLPESKISQWRIWFSQRIRAVSSSNSLYSKLVAEAMKMKRND